MYRILVFVLCLYCVKAGVIGNLHTQENEHINPVQDRSAVLLDRASRPTTESALRQKRSGYSYSWAKSWASAWSYGGAQAQITAVAPSHGGGKAISTAIANSYGNAVSQARATSMVANGRRWRRSVETA